MRVIASGNLTVELIRAQRFDVAHHCDNPAEPSAHRHNCKAEQHEYDCQRIDKVQLSPEALESDPWALPTERSGKAEIYGVPSVHEPTPDEQPPKPKRLSPVVGSPALAGLGAAWVVPGTLLDVVA